MLINQPSLIPKTMHDLNWTNPFRILHIQYLRHVPIEKRNSYTPTVFVACSKEFTKLSAIWSRIELDCGRALRLQQLIRKFTYNEPISDVEDIAHGLYLEGAWYLDIDYQSFIFQAKILMDRIAYATLPLYNLRGISPHHSFTKHKEFFEKEKKKMEQIDKGYANHIINNTDWYDDLISARDKFIAHGRPHILATGVSPDEHPLITRIVVGSPAKERHLHTRKELVAKYMNKMLVSDKGWERKISNLNELARHMNSEDRKQFTDALQETGGELPDAYELARGIIEFANFYSKHFTARFKKS